MFPDWESVGRLREVLTFACGLTAEKGTVLEFVYDAALARTADPRDCKEFLRTVWGEMPSASNVDPLRNKYLNFVDAREPRVGSSPIIVPSKSFIFGVLSLQDPAVAENILLKKDPSVAVTEPAECRILGGGNCFPALQLMRRISEFQELVISRLEVDVPSESTKELLSVLKLSEGASHIRIKSRVDSTDTVQFVQHITAQLDRCDKLDELTLERLPLPAELIKTLPHLNSLTEVTLDESHFQPTDQHCEHVEIGNPAFRSLRKASFRDCNMPEHVCRTVLRWLACCPQLYFINLRGNVLTNGMKLLLGSGVTPPFPRLRVLRLGSCTLSEADVKHVAWIVRGTRLEELDLSENTLTGCVTS